MVLEECKLCYKMDEDKKMYIDVGAVHGKCFEKMTNRINNNRCAICNEGMEETFIHVSCKGKKFNGY